ncbi:MAG: hydroxymethylglutaryl-CoA reductase, degradative [Woeseia sp.]
MTIDSQYPKFYRLDIAARLELLVANGVLRREEATRLARGEMLLNAQLADKMIENVIGVFGLPLAVAPGFLIDGHERLAPLVVEEPSIVAGLSGAAKLLRGAGGFETRIAESLLIGQIQLVDIDDADAVVRALRDCEGELKRLANVVHPKLAARGGGVRELEYFKYRLQDGSWTVVLHVLVDTCDAMGANLVNTLCESIAPRVATISGARVALKILSNLADRSLVTARVHIPVQLLQQGSFSGEFIRDEIIQATLFADADPYRAVTHNKGIMNGIDAVAIATGNDWRAIEAGAHAYAARSGHYGSLTSWQLGADGGLLGEISLPLKVGVVGGSLMSNPAVPLALQIAGVTSSRELASLLASVGLAQNFAALRALVTHGIQKGHMSLHARSVAAGAPPQLFDRVVQGLIDSGQIKTWKADELISEYLAEAPTPGVAAQDAPAGTACAKVILLGEHAAVYDKHVLAVPIPNAVTARISKAGVGARIRIPAWGIDEALGTDKPPAGAAATAALIISLLQLPEALFSIDVEARIPAAMGLGASAALAVAIIRAFDALLNLGLDNRGVDALAFECEKLAHGTPSGIDNNLATYGETVLYTRSTASRTRPIPLTEAPPLVVAASGQRGMTRDMVDGVRRRYQESAAMYDTIFSEIDELSIAGAVALRDGDYAALGRMMNVCQGFLNAIEVSTPELERMIHIARSNGAIGAKLTGSGGGGSIVALCPGHGNEVAQALQSAGYAIIRTSDDRNEKQGNKR